MVEFEDKNRDFYTNIESTPGQRKGCILAIVSILIFFIITYMKWNLYALDIVCIIGIILGFSRSLNFITEIFPDYGDD